jgi:regulator of nucleoside diphosphate kinase
MNQKPPITLSSQDLDRLESLLDQLPQQALAGQAALRAELDRADIVEPDQIPPSTVTMNSTVRFAIEPSTEEFCKTLVYPKNLDGTTEQVSILAPIGGALLGMSEGSKMEWKGPDGDVRKVHVVEVVYQPESAGEPHR